MNEAEIELCIPTTRSLDGRGYGQISIKGVTHKHHRVVYAESRGLDISEIKGFVVRHSCDNPECVNPSHLQIGTQRDNVMDMIARGRHIGNIAGTSLPGEQNGRAKLDWAKVRDIRLRIGSSARQLAREYLVDPKCIRMILAGKTWKE